MVIKTIRIKNSNKKSVLHYYHNIKITKTYLSHLTVEGYYTFSSNILKCESMQMEMNLEQMIHSNNLTYEMSANNFKEICHIVKYFQFYDLIHGNLKPTNIFITKERKICTLDYFLNEIREIVNPNVIYYYYFSPEQISGKEMNSTSDIWSLGCVLYFIFAKSHLFVSDSLYHLISLQQNTKFINLTCPSVYNDIINGTLKYIPKERMTIREILQLLSNSIILYFNFIIFLMF